MRAISIQQPWGTLICAGIKDVENRSWNPGASPVRVLIHTGARRQKIDEATMPLIWANPIENAQTMGIIGWIDGMPTSAVIGVATIERCDEVSSSVWAQTGPQAKYKWVMRDVQMFREPIRNVKGKLGIFDIPEISEDNLPECISLPEMKRDKKHMTIPLCDDLFRQIKSHKADTVMFNLTEDNLPLFCTKTLRPRATEAVTFVCGRQKLDVEVDSFSIEPVCDSNNDIFEFTDPLGRNYYWYRVFITVKKATGNKI